MKVIHGKIGEEAIFEKDGLAITIGNFDGVHRGHQRLIQETKKMNIRSCIFTFNPHPEAIINPSINHLNLISIEEKIDEIGKINPDYLFIIDFDENEAFVTKEEFINWLLKMNVKKVVCGRDYRFGYKAMGTVADLKKYFEVKVLDDLLISEKRISSSLIKEYLSDGNIIDASKSLGRYYYISGIVLNGSHIGKKLGFPTANIETNDYVKPKNGVYAVKVLVDDKFYYGMANLGKNPTVNLIDHTRLEVNIFDFNKDIYGKKITVYFLCFLRPEKCFNSKDELISELKRNKEQINNLIKRGEII